LTGDREEQRNGVLRSRDRVRSRGIEYQYTCPGGGADVDIVHADTSPSHHPQVAPGPQDLFTHFRLAADHEGISFAHGLEQSWDIQPVDVDDGRRGREPFPGSGMDRVADHYERTVLHGIGSRRGSTGREGVVHSILPSAGDVGGDEIEEAIKIIRGRDHRVVGCVVELSGLDKETGYARRGVIPGVAETIFDRVTEPGTKRHCRFQIGEDDRAVRELMRPQPGPGHLSRGFRPGRHDSDIVSAD
jgi:hypothetical protein